MSIEQVGGATVCCIVCFLVGIIVGEERERSRPSNHLR